MRDRRRRDVLRGAAGIGAAVTLAGCLGGGGDGDDDVDAPEGTEVVEAGPNGNLVFDPDELTVSTDTTVRFVWQSNTHNVVVTSQPENADWSGHEDIENDGFSFESTLEVPGRYEYVCGPHRTQGMTGAIVVEE